MTYYKVKYINKTTKVKTTEVCTGKRYDEIEADKNLRVTEATNYRRDFIPEQIGIIKEENKIKPIKGKLYECYAQSEESGKWFWCGWREVYDSIRRENSKYWFTEDGYRYRKPLL